VTEAPDCKYDVLSGCACTPPTPLLDLGDYLSWGWCVGALAPLPLLIWVWGIICLGAGVWVCLHPSHSPFGSGGLFVLRLVCGCACTPPTPLLDLGDYLFWCQCVGALALLLLVFGSGWLFVLMPVCGCACTPPAHLLVWGIIWFDAGVWVQSSLCIYMLTIYFYSNSNQVVW